MSESAPNPYYLGVLNLFLSSAFFIRLKQKYSVAGPTRSSRLGNRIYVHLRDWYLRPKFQVISRIWRLGIAKYQDFLLSQLSSLVIARFPAYAPGSRGGYSTLAKMTLSTINRVPAVLSELAEFSGSSIPIVSLSGWGVGKNGQAERLGKLLNHHGSDKTRHGYHTLYAQILGDTKNVRTILEIGLGSNNEDVISNMTSAGSPGASLRAFRDFCENAEIYGADVDRRVLFEEERIRTFWVDQLDNASIRKLRKTIPDDFDLVIDDGLHSPDANISTLILGLHAIKPGGWIVIEDIKPEAEPLWRVVGALLPERFEATMIQANYALVFAVQRLF